MTNSSNRWIKKAFARLREEFGGKCKTCGNKSRLEFAHIVETPISKIKRGRGRKERYFDIVRNKNCYVLLCHTCHHQLDTPTHSIENVSGRAIPK